MVMRAHSLEKSSLLTLGMQRATGVMLIFSGICRITGGGIACAPCPAFSGCAQCCGCTTWPWRTVSPSAPAALCFGLVPALAYLRRTMTAGLSLPGLPHIVVPYS